MSIGTEAGHPQASMMPGDALHWLQQECRKPPTQQALTWLQACLHALTASASEVDLLVCRSLVQTSTRGPSLAAEQLNTCSQLPLV